MSEIIKGMACSMIIYLLLPDVPLSKMQTILILIVGCMVCTAVIWWVQEKVQEHRFYKRRREFRELMEKTTMKGGRRCG